MASAMFRTPIAITRLAMTCSKFGCRQGSNRPYAKCRGNPLSAIAIGLIASETCFPEPDRVWWRMLCISRKYLFQS